MVNGFTGFAGITDDVQLTGLTGAHLLQRIVGGAAQCQHNGVQFFDGTLGNALRAPLTRHRVVALSAPVPVPVSALVPVLVLVSVSWFWLWLWFCCWAVALAERLLG